MGDAPAASLPAQRSRPLRLGAAGGNGHVIAAAGIARLYLDADHEASLAAPEHHDGSQVGWSRGNDQDREAEAPEPILPEVTIVSPVPKLRAVPPAPLPWGGEGNVVAAAGAVLLALVVGA